MFEILDQVPLDVASEAGYQAMWRLHHRAPHHDVNDGLAPGTENSPENQALRVILREMREAEGCRISEISDEAASRYTRALSARLEARRGPLSPEMVQRATATLEEMRRKYGRAA